ncbi:hypothetical protein AQ436_10380 [Arthrobacter sp. EpRS66]|nr:hypothetical protein AQ436_10380 [Arthrobacter sp. EpRS66]
MLSHQLFKFSSHDGQWRWRASGSYVRAEGALPMTDDKQVVHLAFIVRDLRHRPSNERCMYRFRYDLCIRHYRKTGFTHGAAQ